MRDYSDLTGLRFGRWTVLRKAENQISKSGKTIKTRWHCVCDCGNESDVATGNLKSGKSLSCGCLQRERSGEALIRHNRTHGQTKTRLFRIWSGIKTRCYNKNDRAYPRYGGRGIAMCAEWKADFEKFRDWALANGYSDDLSCDRIDNDGDYCPENCRWATMKQQGRNKRTNRLITIKGETLTVAEWAERNGLDRNIILNRLKKGWPPEEAATVKSHEREEKPGKYLIEFNGETHTLATWSKILNIPRRNLYQRIYLCGWSVDRALTEPVAIKKRTVIERG